MNVKELIFGAQAGAAQSLTPADKDLQGSLPIADIDRGVIRTRDGRLAGLFEVLPMNFFLQNTAERERIISCFAAWPIPMTARPDATSTAVMRSVAGKPGITTCRAARPGYFSTKRLRLNSKSPSRRMRPSSAHMALRSTER